MIDLAAGVATLAFVLVGMLVGARLLAMAFRTRGLPEATLGLGLFLIVGVGYALLITAMALPGGGRAPGTLTALATVSMTTGWMAVWVFTWRVFRPGSRLAGCVTGVALCAMAAGAIVQAATYLMGDPNAIAPNDTAAWTVIRLSALTVYVWSGTESVRYWRTLRRRMRIGLADPVVTNRVFLWAVVTWLSFASLLGPTVSVYLGHGSVDNPELRIWTGLTGLVCGVALYLAFLPPKAYLARLERART